MNKDLKIPPKSIEMLTSPGMLSQHLLELIGRPFVLTGKTRTDGSEIRKLVASILEKYSLPAPAEIGKFEILPPKGKGVPKITREFIDTYIVTSGTFYNLQVWNRVPTAESLLIKYESGDSLKCTDVRFIFVRIDTMKSIVASILILTPEYIEHKFGKFGNPTIKHQLLISKKVRNEIYNSKNKILTFPDSLRLSRYVRHDYQTPASAMIADPDLQNLFSIELLRKIVGEKLIGFKLPVAPTKTRGQAVEKKVLELLDYQIKESDLLCGGFPDIKNQLLEVKIQDSPPVDLDKFSPEKEEQIIERPMLTTFDVRYLIALTNPQTEIIEGVIISPGEKLGELFSYVSAQSYKCQRSIPMKFFNAYNGKSVFNPA